jgi:hypothetical protein
MPRIMGQRVVRTVGRKVVSIVGGTKGVRIKAEKVCGTMIQIVGQKNVLKS